MRNRNLKTVEYKRVCMVVKTPRVFGHLVLGVEWFAIYCGPKSRRM